VTDNPTKIMTDALATQIVQNTTLHLNLSQEAIVITEDKVRLCLIQHLGKIEARKEWIAPAGVVLTLLITFATTTFRDFGLKADVWQAMFVIATLLSVVWLLRAIWRAWKAPTVADVVLEMKQAGATETARSPASSGRDT